MSELYLPYVSAWLRNQISAGTLVVGHAQEFEATLLYADLGGFTALTAAFADLPDGAERLHDSLSRFYSTLTATVAAHDADVVSIAGDALTAWWPERVDLQQARRCARAMLSAVATLPPIATPAGPFTLDLHIGVAAGPVSAVLVGLPSQSVHLVIYGPAHDAVVAAERVAAAGQLHVAPPISEMAGDVIARAVAEPHTPFRCAPSPRFSSPEVRLNAADFLPPSFAERIRIGALLAEYRRCVPAFAAFTMPADAAALHDLVAQVQTIVARWGGWLNEVELGDKGAVFVLLFGAPVTRGDDPTRAVGCCLELRARGLISHAGITVGTLFVGAVGSTSRRVYTAQGDEMNLAAYLMQMARPGEILVSGRVRHEIAGRYQVGDLVPTLVKGHERPVPVARITSLVRGSSAVADLSLRPYLFSTAPLVGRAHERAVLEEAMASAIAGHPRVVVVEGESGIGKSSLLHELMAQWIGRGLVGYGGECSSGQPAPLLPWRPILAGLCGADEASVHASRAEHLASILQQQGVESLYAPTAARLLSQMLGLDDADGSRALLDDAQMTGGILNRGLLDDARIAGDILEARMLDLALTLIRHRLRQGPLLILLEDVHWADDLSLRLAARLTADVGDPLPLLLVLSHRPLDAPPPALAALRDHERCTRLPMGLLSRHEVLDLARVLLDVDYVSQNLGDLIEHRTLGQPLFIKEFIKALSEHRVIAIKDRTAHLVGNPAGVQVPDTVQGIIQARVDRLDEATRLTLKVAAVIGRTFQLSLLAAMHPAHPPAPRLVSQIEQLISLGMLELELDAPERVYRFKHSITHEVAYASLLFGQRRALHAVAARWYEQAYAGDIRQQTAALAVYRLLVYHYGRAEETDLHAHYCRAAAAQAVRQYANTTAQEYLTTALVLTTDIACRYDLFLLRVALNDRVGDRLAQADDIVALQTFADRLDDDLRRAQAGCWWLGYLLSLGRYSQVVSEAVRVRLLADTASHKARHTEDRWLASLLQAATLEAQSAATCALGDAVTARLLAMRALTICKRVRAQQAVANAESWPAARSLMGHYADPDPLLLSARCYNSLGGACRALGELDLADEYHRQALDLARQAGDWIGEARSLALMGQVAVRQGDYATARRFGERALTICHATGDRAGQAAMLRDLASFSAAVHNYEEAQRFALHALAVSSSIGAAVLEQQVLNDLAAITLALGDIEDAATIRASLQAQPVLDG